MEQYLLEMFSVSLLLTLVIELTVAGCFKIPFGKQWLPVILVNILTNPAVVAVNWLLGLYFPQMKGLGIQLLLECLVVFVEFIIYKDFAGTEWCCKKPFLLAIVSNSISWLFGVLISL